MGDNHGRSASTIIHQSYPAVPLGVSKQASIDNSKINGNGNGNGKHQLNVSQHSNFSSTSNASMMSSNTMGTLGTVQYEAMMGQHRLTSMDTVISMASSNAISMGDGDM